MKFGYLLLNLVLVTSVWALVPYYPGEAWEKRKPETVGIDPDTLAHAVSFAQENESTISVDLRQAILKGFEFEPFHDIKGPTRKRGGPAGLIIKDGYIVAEWGDVKRVDMTFSVTKSYLSTVAGLALDEGLIRGVNDPVREYVWDGSFDTEHNSKITWHHLLNQSSDWAGELFGMEDWSDRPPREGDIDDWRNRELMEPGIKFEYNDVRVNLLAYSLLNVWRKPLPQVLKNRIMDPIGASSTWRWYGYETSWVTMDGQKMQSVSGGGHSGGGLFISTEDHARFGLLFLRDGLWKDRELISKEWIERVQQPSEANPGYGYMWWLNKGERKWNNQVSSSVYYAAGFGGNYIIVDKEHDLLVVVRWIDDDKLDAFMELVAQATYPKSGN